MVLGYATLGCVFLLRRPLTAVLSPRARWLCLVALGPFSRRPVEWALAGVSIILGVWTHLLWDSFTHTDGWMVRRVAALSAPVIFGWDNGTGCHVLQYLSSAFGLAAMTLWYRRLPAPLAAPAGPGAPRSSVGPVLTLVAAAAILIGAEIGRAQRLNSSHLVISYAVFCLKKKKSIRLLARSRVEAHNSH